MNEIIEALNELKNKISSADIPNELRGELEDDADAMIEKVENAEAEEESDEIEEE